MPSGQGVVTNTEEEHEAFMVYILSKSISLTLTHRYLGMICYEEILRACGLQFVERTIAALELLRSKGKLVFIAYHDLTHVRLTRVMENDFVLIHNLRKHRHMVEHCRSTHPKQ